MLLAPDVYRALREIADRAGQTPSELMAALLTKAAGEARGLIHGATGFHRQSLATFALTPR